MSRHLLVTGHNRAGSTLLYGMLQRCLDGFNIPGPEFPARAVLHMPGNTCSRRSFDIFDFEKIVAAAEGRKRLDMIVMLRDPRDILTSYDPRLPDDYACSADKSYFVAAQGRPEQLLPGVLQTHARINETIEAGHLPQGVVLLKYEHLVSDPDRVQNLLATCLELEFTGRFGEVHKHERAGSASGASDTPGLTRERIEKWRAPHHRARIIDQFSRFPELHEIVIDLGYERDTGWFDRLVAAGDDRPAIPA
ncbi:hypothetical protein OB2597_15915 [Pseudooceanicola batsensis HTCC2597]|uniref:Sulfotransferase domain-containing protein n=1 Tax=Pseudooceanicola batsensis (strain ATCC BAA-863 / DSM 15984 / KCTC 12145 / HTCC2597) TaxID=252305 RepID=A3TZ65_PSEBH|nr:hypothetical protein [Pseudooceanicola batsensis]EAQ02883.1 hypothetical protein OB2597_15915 [Pseudooceanicola batsensis HTCC2597]